MNIFGRAAGFSRPRWGVRILISLLGLALMFAIWPQNVSAQQDAPAPPQDRRPRPRDRAGAALHAIDSRTVAANGSADCALSGFAGGAGPGGGHVSRASRRGQPLVNNSSSWYFDTEAGKQEILFRRIGRNEISTISVCQELVAAQKEYYSAQHNEYAQKIFSDEGQHNGLYWKAAEGEPQSPIGPLVASAFAEGPKAETALRLLTAVTITAC